MKVKNVEIYCSMKPEKRFRKHIAKCVGEEVKTFIDGHNVYNFKVDVKHSPLPIEERAMLAFTYDTLLNVRLTEIDK